MDTDEFLTPELTPLAVRAAVEGIPVRAISRILGQPSDVVYATLHEQHIMGRLVELPRADWPPTARAADHLPQMKVKPSDDDILFACRRQLKLTSLEAGFLVVLLKHDRAEKAKLHHVIEQQRQARSTRPDTMELTDLKMVDVMICKLRKKMRDLDPRFVIETVWGGGYYVDDEVKRLIVDRIFPKGGPDGVSHLERASDPDAATPRHRQHS